MLKKEKESQILYFIASGTPIFSHFNISEFGMPHMILASEAQLSLPMQQNM